MVCIFNSLSRCTIHMESTISAFPNIHSGLFWIPQRGEHHNVLASLDLFPNWSAMTGLVKGILKINSAAKCGIREWCTCRALPHTDYWLPPLCRAHSSRSSRSGDRSVLPITSDPRKTPRMDRDNFPTPLSSNRFVPKFCHCSESTSFGN